MAQTRAVCTGKAFTALRALPELHYDCPDNVNDWDEVILKNPARVEALKQITAELRSFNNPQWWSSSVSDLTTCEIRGAAGVLSREERERLRSGDFQYRLFGDDRFRLVQVFDPCYQADYNGSSLFLLYRPGKVTFVTRLIDGFYSRVDNSIDMNVAWLNGDPIIEIASSNNMPPTFIYKYFVINRRTNTAAPKRLFKDQSGFTNELQSPMLLDNSRDSNGPVIIKNKSLVPVFHTLEENEGGHIESNGQRYRRIAYRWNGRFYVASRY
jgi:hypothetical protein